MLTKEGIEVISANTDGIICLVKDKEKYKNICSEWESLTGFELEFTEYLKYARRDVNSYITQTVDGKIKTKGIFDNPIGEDLSFSRVASRKYNMPILPKALKSYFIYNWSVEDYVNYTNNIYDYLISHKADKKFDLYIKEGDNLTLTQRTLRYYMPQNGQGYEIIKVGGEKQKDDNKQESLGFLDDIDETIKTKGALAITLCSTHAIKLLNDIDDSIPFEDYKVDKQYYIQEINKIVNEIQPKQKQLSMF